MNLPAFILNGQFQDLKIGSDIRNLKMPFYNMTNEDEDVPAIYNLEEENEDFQFTALKNVVVGISFDFQYETEKVYTISVEELKFELSYKTSFEDLTTFLKHTALDFKINEYGNEESFEVELKKSGVLLSFSKHNLLKASIFDLDLYDKIRNLN